MNLMNFNYKIFLYKKKSRYIQLNYINHQKKPWSLLEVLENYNIPINYQCRSGYCGSCRAILIHGHIQYYKEPIASSMIHTNEILTCCCFLIEDIILQI